MEDILTWRGCDVQRHVKKKLRSNATDVRKFVGRSPTLRYILYFLSLSEPALELFCFEFFSYREKRRVLFFFSVTGLTVFILTGLEPQVVPAIRLRMAFRGIMGHSLWKFPKELSSLEGGKSFRRTRYKARLSIKLSKNSFACVNFYACIPMNRSWRAKNLWELCMSITYDRIFKFFTAIFIETDRNIVRVAVNCLIRQLSSFRALISWRINYTLKFRKI